MFKIKWLVLIFLLPIYAFGSLNAVDKAYFVHKNIMDNGGFENGLSRWSASAGTLAVVTSGTNLLTGGVSSTWDAAALNDTFSYNEIVIPKSLYGKNGQGFCNIKTPSGISTHKLQVTDGTDVISEDTIVAGIYSVQNSVNFVFPTSGNIVLRLEAQKDEPLIAIDDCYLGAAVNISNALVTNSSELRMTGSSGRGSTNTAVMEYTTTALDNDPQNAYTLTNNSVDGTLITMNKAGYVSIQATLLRSTSNEMFLTKNPASYTSISPGITEILSAFTGNLNMAGTMNVSWTGSVVAGDVLAVILDSDPGAGNSNNLTMLFTDAPALKSFTPDVTAMSWSGYFDSTCSFSNTGATLDDPAADASCALVQRTNSNFGTVTAVAGILPQISILPKRAGVYNVCATLGVSSGTTIVATFRLLADSTTLGDIAVWQQAGSPTNASFCALATLSDVSAKVLKIQSAASSGSVAITSVGVSTSAIEWTIYPVSQQLPAPLLVNSVVSSYAGVMATERVYITQPAGVPTVSEEFGDWINGAPTDNALGDFTLTFNAGIFSSKPHCQCTVEAGATNDGTTCFIDTTTTGTSTTMRFQTHDSASAAEDENVYIECTGPR